jgi:hypothetical protein
MKIIEPQVSILNDWGDLGFIDLDNEIQSQMSILNKGIELIFAHFLS